MASMAGLVELRQASRKGKDWLAALQERENCANGIKVR